MKLVLGLGNPGPEYEATRHNIGWWVVEEFGERFGFSPFRRYGPSLAATGRVGQREVLVAKPLTYMNRSGEALVRLLGVGPIDPRLDLLVVVDDVALSVGRVRFRARGGTGGHKGLRSVEAALGSKEYARLRIGVGSPEPGEGLTDWVLASFSADEEEFVSRLLPELAEAVRIWVEEGVEAAGTRFNR